MNKQIGAILLAAASLCQWPVAASANNIVVNGSFEGATATDPTTGDVLPTGWQLGPPSPASLSKCNVDTAINASTFLGPEDGSRYARFQSPANNGTRDCLLQDLTTVVGRKYAVSFWVAETSTSVGNNSGLDPEWNENTVNQQTLAGAYLSPSNTGPVNYQFFSFTETASSTITRLDFHGIDQNGSILLDNVVVSSLIPGDFNRDNHVDASDIQPMMQALTNLNGYKSTYDPSLTDPQLLLIADVNGDGKFTNADLQYLINTLKSGGGSTGSVPEPSTFVLAILVAVMVCGIRRVSLAPASTA
jgi:hypothetical protein